MVDRRRGKRRRLAQGIYADDYGIEVVARVGSGTREVRQSLYFPLGTRLDDLKAARFRLLGDLRDRPEARAALSGTLATEIAAFLAQAPKTRKYEDFGYLLAHWASSPLGEMPRLDISTSMLTQQLEHWRAAGVPPVTLNHRRRAIRAVYQHYRMGDEPLPTDAVPQYRTPQLEARGVPMPIIARILDAIPDHGRAERGQTRPGYSETKIRLRVMAWTGLPHIQLTRLPRTSVNFHDGRLFVPARKKGRGAAGLWVTLTPQAWDALRDYDAAKLWGRPFSRSSMRKTWGKAIARTLRTLSEEARQTGNTTLLEAFTTSVPPDCRPYDLRHSFLTEAYRVTGDFRAVAALAQHADLSTTKRYTEAGVAERVAEAVAKLSDAWAKELPPMVRAPIARRVLSLIPKGTA